MRVHLYRPIAWWSGGALRYLDSDSDISPCEAAALIRLRHATVIHEPTPSFFGDIMSDDTSCRLTLVAGPTSEPVTLAQAKAFLRIEHTADDAAIVTSISAARQYAEHYLRTALLPQTWDYVVANPESLTVQLSVGPAQSITSLTLTSESGEVSVVNASNYRLSVDGFAVLLSNVPVTEKMTVRYSAGLVATPAEIPAPIVQGLLHHMAVMMETRDGSVPLPMQAMTCYAPFRRVSL